MLAKVAAGGERRQLRGFQACTTFRSPRLYSDLHFHARRRFVGISSANRRNHVRKKLVHLLRRATDELRGLHFRVQIDFGKRRVGRQPVEQIVRLARAL